LIFKDDISRTVLVSLNQKINGEITFSDISFTPFRNFPDAGLKFYDLTFYESKDTLLRTKNPAILNVKEAYLSVNIVDLFKNRKINASSVGFEDGFINLVIYPDSQTNIQKAIHISSVSQVRETKKIPIDTLKTEVQKVSDVPPGLNLKIENLEMTDLEVAGYNYLTENNFHLKINELQSGISFDDSRIVTSLNLDAYIDAIVFKTSKLISNQQINFETSLQIDADSFYVKLEEGIFSIAEAEFYFEGIFDSKNQGYLDVSFDLSDEDFSLLSFFLKDEGIKNIKSGDLFVEGLIKGKSFTEFPTIEISFGLKEVNLTNPFTNREIKNLNLKGSFTSGNKNDLSNAELKIDTLYADLENGQFNSSGTIGNLKSPEIDFNLFLSADVTGLDKVFKLGSVTDLKGKVEINDHIKAKYYIEEKKLVSSINNAKIFFEDFGMTVPGVLKLDKIDGTIIRTNNDISFNDFSVLSEDTDIIINGEIKNALALLFDQEEEITGELQIKSKVFDLPNFLFFDPSIKRDFNYRLLDVDVDVIAKTTTSKATRFKSFPEIEFDIKKIHTTAENFLPRLEINSGLFKISEDILGFNLKFTDFKTNFLDGKFNFTGEYNTSKYQPYYIKMKADFDKLSPAKLFSNVNDTIPDSSDGSLSGSFFTEFQFPTDSTVLKFINLKNADLVYEFSKDTIVTKALSIDFHKIYFNENKNSNPFATLHTIGKLKAEIIKSSSFNFNDIEFEINITNGKYEIKSDVVRLFGENAKGKSVITLIPFIDEPTYNINFNEVRFHAEKMLSTFMEDPVISGPLQLSLNISASGSEWDSIVKNVDGTINLSGNNLLLNGFDADELIEDFQRSQNFNMVDLGAVLLAGPVGLAVTKGSDFARMFVFNSGKSTNIVQLVSNWHINNGLFSIEDAAFTTNKNRIALVGSIGFANKNLDLTIALLNKESCSVFSQQLYGNLDAPTLGEVKVVGTVLAPVTNLVDDVIGNDCVVFYRGSVEHPVSESNTKSPKK
jgi:AsmA protein